MTVQVANFVAGANSKIGVKLDNGTYHWTTIAANSGNTITLSASIPAGRSAPSGAPVYVNVWRPLPVLALVDPTQYTTQLASRSDTWPAIGK